MISHAAIYKAYQATGMARSSGVVTRIEKPGNFEHAKSGVRYEVYAKNDGAFFSFDLAGVHGSRRLEYFIGSLHWLDALTPPLEAHLQRLAESVKVLLTKLSSKSSQDVASALPTPPRVRYCIYCGTRNDVQNKFCIACGRRIHQ